MAILTEQFREIESRLQFPAEAVQAFDALAARLDAGKFGAKFETIRRAYLNGKCGWGRTVKKTEALAKQMRVRPETLDFVLCIKCFETAHKRYRRAGIPDEIYWQSADDLRCKLLECIECEHVPGTFVAGWFGDFFTLRRFGVGRFQYEFTDDPADYVTPGGVKVQGGQMLRIHIPSSGVPLTDEVRFDSYRRAWEFFPQFRTKNGLIMFICDSWLLYPAHRKFLPKRSNILRFMDDFTIEREATEQHFHNDWRLFGHWTEYPLAEWPEDTSLCRAYKKWLMDGNLAGTGYGVIVFDGKKIVR